MIWRILAILLWAGVACAATPKTNGTVAAKVQGLGGKVQGVAGATGSSSFVGAPGTTESFEGPGISLTTELSETDASGYINCSSSAAAHSGTYSCEFANETTTAFTHYVRADLGGTDTGFTLTFWWKTPNNGTVWADSTFFAASNSSTATNTSAHNGVITWDGNGTNGKIAFNNEGLTNQVLSTNTFSYNTWYKFVLAYTDGGSSTLKIYNSSNSLIETLTKTLDSQAPRYFYWYDYISMGENTYLDDIQYDSTNP